MTAYVTLQIYLQPGEEEHFEQTYREISQQLRGTICGQQRDLLLRPLKTDDPYILLSAWESLEAYQAWIASEQHRKDVAPLRRHWETTYSQQYLLVNRVDLEEQTVG